VRISFADIPNGHVGKQWHETKKAFRPTAGLSTYEQRAVKRKEQETIKAKEKEMKEEKAATRQVCCHFTT
jgi:rRNA-processing protein CGR1